MVNLSGSGKSTTQYSRHAWQTNSWSGLPNGTDTATIKNTEASSFRRKVRLCLPRFHLLDTLSVKDNIYSLWSCLESLLQKWWKKLVVMKILASINYRKVPYEISGGQKQRVAGCTRHHHRTRNFSLLTFIAGASRPKSSAALLDIFDCINEQGQTILMQPTPTAALVSNVSFHQGWHFLTTKSTVVKRLIRCSKKSLTP